MQSALTAHHSLAGYHLHRPPLDGVGSSAPNNFALARRLAFHREKNGFAMLPPVWRRVYCTHNQHGDPLLYIGTANAPHR